MKNFKQAIGFWWRFTKPVISKHWYVFSAILVLTATSMIEPYVYKLIIDELTKLVGVNEVDWGLMLTYFAVWGGVSLIGLAFYSWYKITLNVDSMKIERDYYNYMYERFLSMDISRHLTKKSGELYEKFEKAVEALWVVNTNLFFQVLPSWFPFLGVLTLAFIVSWQMTLFM
ncbi:hypothetical protein GF376_01200, partial [Candidatus Peregrinibacteria bacterium]|nr:hypothetical protein [Candidatus Peregrinibacteria bacterium]